MGPRSLNDFESKLLIKLLSEDFLGVSNLRQQTEGLLVTELDPEGSLKFHVSSEHLPSDEVQFRIPVEAEYFDRTSSVEIKPAAVHILLHVVSGFLDELEIYKDDLSKIESKPDIELLTITVRR